jgi:ubiquinone/menaquinone biosynthesis C-methylase UbiE
VSVESYFQQHAEQFHALYEEGASWQRWLNHRLRAGIYQRVELTLREVEGSRDFTVLDVGCGSGRNSALFVKVGASRVLGLDIAENMLRLARDFSRLHGTEAQSEFRQGDFTQLALAERFDVVVALGVFDYIAEPVSFLQKMRVSATQKVIASFPGVSLVRSPLRKLRYRLRGCPVYFYSREQVERIAREAGFEHAPIVSYASSGLLLHADVSKQDVSA